MPVPHARATAVTSTDEHAAGEVPDCWRCWRRSRTRGSGAAAGTCWCSCSRSRSACAPAGAKNFREIGDQAADLPQEVLRRLGGTPRPLRGKIIAPSEKRIRTLVHAIGADALDDLTGGWLRALADAGRLDHLLTAIAIDGKWLRGVADGQVKLFAAMLHEEKVMIAQHRIPDETTETTQVRELPEPVDLENAVVTADAAHAHRETAEYIAGQKTTGTGNRTTSCSSRAASRHCSAPSTTLSSATARASRTTLKLDYGHGRIIRRSISVTDAGNLDFPHAARVARIRRDGYDITGTLISKEIVHAVTSLDEGRASAADLARIARGQRGIESVH